MAVSILYLDDHGEQVAGRVSDITYKSASWYYYWGFHNKYWIFNPSEKTFVFEIGSDKRGFIKSDLITFYVRFRGYKKSGWYGQNYPEKNTIYISPEENGLKQHEYYSLCYQEAEEKIRAIAKLVSLRKSDIPIEFSCFAECFYQTFFVDAFTIEKTSICYFTDAVKETIARLKEKLNGSEDYYGLFYFQLPDIPSVKYADFFGALNAIKHYVANLKFKVELGLNNSSEHTVSITAAISYRHPKREANGIIRKGEMR